MAQCCFSLSLFVLLCKGAGHQECRQQLSLMHLICDRFLIVFVLAHVMQDIAKRLESAAEDYKEQHM